MISAWWLLVDFIAGGVVAIILLALLAANHRGDDK